MTEIPQDVKLVMETLEAAGHEAWCVGGCVRDLRLGRTPEDWDVTTNALPEQTLALFGDRALPTGLRHGTVTVRTSERAVEITTFRRDGNYRDHRRPERVTFTCSLEEDLSRRDFTVNAMAMDLRGVFRDPFGGAEDLKMGILRCVGEPERRFREDALRMMRGLRFAADLAFSIHPQTAAGIHRCRELLAEIAPERIQTELTRLLTGQQPAEVLRAYPDVLGVFWPEILPMVGLDQRNRHHCYDVWEHTLHALSASPPDPVVRYTMLLHDIGKPDCMRLDEDGRGHFRGHPVQSARMAEQMLRRLRFDNRTRACIVRLVEWHDRPIAATDPAVRRCLRALGEEDLRRLLAVKRADNLAQAPAYQDRQRELDRVEAVLDRLVEENACVSLRQLAVSGRDLLALGYVGPAVGRELNQLLDAVVDGVVPNERASLLDWARKDRQDCR
ncbi:HD domain-containing protein [uncultured Oscillibacter sp.]|uniref:CCA tRNA nucleotidyltransferase n=2 Tax=environmental samples TaxID=876090 RepID=UPI0025CE3C79|nr:HD domain-containing protein [uncultured Oscillibacter sp.]